MATDNRISLTLGDEDRSEILDAIAVLQSKLAPLLVELQADERKEMPKMGDKTVAFVTKAAEHGQQNPTFVPAYIDLAEFQKDLDAVETLRGLYHPLAQITKMLDDSILLAGSEAYVAALGIYNSLKGAMRANVPGAALAYEDLRVRFPGRGRRTASPETE